MIMKRLAIALAALMMSVSAHAAVYEVVCMKSEVTRNTTNTAYRVLFDDVNRILIIHTGTKLIPYDVHDVMPHGAYVEAVGTTPIGTAWRARFTDHRLETNSIREMFASFNGRQQVTDQCEEAME